MSWTAARAALDARMSTLPSLGTSQIEWPNTQLAPQTALYYAVYFLPASVNPELQGGDHEEGIYQVSVFVPAGGGAGTAITQAQAVADHFKRQTLSGISCGVPTLAPPIQQDTWWHVPVSIPFLVL
jgi:hypothetical protein